MGTQQHDLLSLHFPHLDYWSILGFTWPIDTTRPSQTLISDKVRNRFAEAQQNAMLTGRVAWEILEAARVLLDRTIEWSALLEYACNHCDPQSFGEHHDLPISSYGATKSFAHGELTKPTYQRCAPSNGPPLEHLSFDHKLSFADLTSLSAPPSICIGSLSPGGHLVFAYLDASTDRFLCVASNFDDWGQPIPSTFDRSNDELLVCICAPYTRISKASLKDYIRAYTAWCRDSSPPESLDGATDAESGSPIEMEICKKSPIAYDNKTKFLWFSMQ